MAALVGRVDTEVLVDHRTFDLIDDSGEQDAATNGGSAQWLFAGQNQITVRSAGQYHVAALIVEAWDAEPPPAEGWTAPHETSVRLDSGYLEINPLVEGEDAEDITVGGPGPYRVRGYVTGRDDLAAALTTAGDQEPHGIERYLLQLWPE